MLQAPRHPYEPRGVKGHKDNPEAYEREPEGRLAPAFVEPEAERLREPISEAGKASKHHAANNDVVEMGDQKKAVVELEIGWDHGEKHAGHAADHESHDESNRPQHRRRKTDAAAIHCEDPIIDLYASWDCDDSGGGAKKAVDVGSRSHCEEVVQPNHE